MDDLLIFIEQLLWLLFYAEAARNFFPLRKSRQMFGGPMLVFALMQTLIIRLFPVFVDDALLLVCLLLWLIVLFQPGRMIRLVLFAFILGLICFLTSWLLEQLLYNRGLALPSMPLAAGFEAQILTQLLFYGLMMLRKLLKSRHTASLLYAFPMIPLVLTGEFLLLWNQISPGFSDPAAGAAVLFILIIIDSFSLVLQSSMIALIRTRQSIHLETARREVLLERYEQLQREYQESFRFLHALLSSCAAIAREHGENSPQAKEISGIAASAFSHFNDLCVITPALRRLLDQKKKHHQKQGIRVTTLVQSDHFGLMTSAEQTQLFSALLDFMETQAVRTRQSAGIYTLSMRSGAHDKDILLACSFPCTNDQQLMQAFQVLQASLSRSFHAGVSLHLNSSSEHCQGQIRVVIPVVSYELEQFLSSGKTGLAGTLVSQNPFIWQ